jgi:epoxyqueuosine reductase
MKTQKIKSKALELGYIACGIIPSSVFEEYSRCLDERVKTFPESKELYEPLYALARPHDEGKSVIVCIRRYSKYKVPAGLIGIIGKVYMFDGRVPFSREYRAKLEFEAYLGTLGMKVLQKELPVRWAAAKAGLGKFGHNNFIYHQEHGSYIWIDTWTVNKELDYDDMPEDAGLSCCNENCHKCVKACPTNALSNKFSMNRGKCVTNVVGFSQDVPKEDIRSKLGLWIYGCDACQDACPLNKDKLNGTEEFPLLKEYEEYLKPENILKMDEETYLNVINPRFWYGGKDGLWLWKCNALRFMINSELSDYHQLIKQSCNDTDSRVKEMARWGCDKLNL